jgi:hypothetical protein
MLERKNGAVVKNLSQMILGRTPTDADTLTAVVTVVGGKKW